MICRNIQVKIIFLSLVIAFVCLFSLSQVSAEIFDIENESYYSSQSISVSDHIQNIIDNNASSGDTLRFKGNSYNNISILIDKKLNLASSNTKFIGSNNSNGITINSLNGSGTCISGFTFSNYNTAIILDQTGDINFTNIAIENNLNGLIISNSKAIIIKDSDFLNNKDSLNGSSTGVSLYNCTNIRIENSKFLFNHNGLYIDGIDNFTFVNNTVENNSYNGMSIEKSIASNVIIFNNSFRFQRIGIYIDCDVPNLTIVKNYLMDHFIIGSGIYFGVNMKFYNSNVVKDNIFIRNAKRTIDGHLVTKEPIFGANLVENNGWTCGVYYSLVFMKLLRTGPTTFTAFLVSDDSGKVNTNLPDGDIIFNVGSKTIIVPMKDGLASINLNVMDLITDISASFFGIGATLQWDDLISDFLDTDDPFLWEDWTKIPEFIPDTNNTDNNSNGTINGNNSGNGGDSSGFGSGSNGGDGSGSQSGNGNGNGFSEIDGLVASATTFKGSGDLKTSIQDVSSANSPGKSTTATSNEISGSGDSGSGSGLKTVEIKETDDINEIINLENHWYYYLGILLLGFFIAGYYTQRRKNI